MRQKTRKKSLSWLTLPSPVASRPHAECSMDFMADHLADGRRSQVLTCVGHVSPVRPAFPAIKVAGRAISCRSGRIHAVFREQRIRLMSAGDAPYPCVRGEVPAKFWKTWAPEERLNSPPLKEHRKAREVEISPGITRVDGERHRYFNRPPPFRTPRIRDHEPAQAVSAPERPA